MAQAYLDKVLNEVFHRSVNIESRVSSESGNIHHAIITKDFMETAYGAGMDEAGVQYTRKDLSDLSEEFMDGVIRAITNKGLQWKETKLGGGGIIISSKPRATKAKAVSTKSLQDLKDVVGKGKQYARPMLNKLVQDEKLAGKIQGGLQYAHGEGGLAKSTIGTERGLGAVAKLNSPESAKELEKYVKDGNLFMKSFNTSLRDFYAVDLGWDVIRVNPKTGKAKISDEIEISGAFKMQDPDFSRKYDLPGMTDTNKFSSKFRNTLRAELKKALNKAVTDGAMQPHMLQGSPTPVDRAKHASAKAVISELEAALKKADLRGVVTVKTALTKLKETKTKQKGKPKTYKGKRKGEQNTRTGKKAKGQTKTQTKNTNVSPLALKSLLQKALPAAIAKKMTGPPTLQWQTGRFAQSAEITNIVPMQKQVEIEYDYMQSPYRVFEQGSGSPLASPRRDPRQIIGGTIRELAQQIMGNKFLIRTKRV